MFGKLKHALSPDKKPRSDEAINISVIGLSGIEKGKQGVGKSCLCARFMANEQDNYKKNDYKSEISFGEFNGPVIKGDHFLYWGEKEIAIKSRLERNHNNSSSLLEPGLFNSSLDLSGAKENQPYNSSGAAELKNIQNISNLNNTSANISNLSTDASFNTSTNSHLTTNFNNSINENNNNNHSFHHSSLSSTTVKCRILEQTIFLEDGTNTVFASKAQKQNYIERACNIKLNGNNRKVYTCNDDLFVQNKSRQNQNQRQNLFKDDHSHDFSYNSSDHHSDKENSMSDNSNNSENLNSAKFMPKQFKVDAFILVIDAYDCRNFLVEQARRRKISSNNNLTNHHSISSASLNNFNNQNQKRNANLLNPNIAFHSIGHNSHSHHNQNFIIDHNRNPVSQFLFLEKICPVLVTKRKPIVIAFSNMDKIYFEGQSPRGEKSEDLVRNFEAFKEAIECLVFGQDYDEMVRLRNQKLYNSSDGNLSNNSKSGKNNSNDSSSLITNNNSSSNNNNSSKKFNNYSQAPEFIEISSELDVNIDKCFQLACTLAKLSQKSNSSSLLKSSFSSISNVSNISKTAILAHTASHLNIHGGIGNLSLSKNNHLSDNSSIPTYLQASEKVNKIRSDCLNNYKSLIDFLITDYKKFTYYNDFLKLIDNKPEYRQMIKIYGTNNHYMTKCFRDRIYELQLTFKAQKQFSYMNYFTQALYELLPDLSDVLQLHSDELLEEQVGQNSNNNSGPNSRRNQHRQWGETRDRLSKMAHFNDWFVVLETKGGARGLTNASSSSSTNKPDNQNIPRRLPSISNPNDSKNKPWFEHPHIDLIEDRRIPHELLSSKEAETLFHQHKKYLIRKDRKQKLQMKFIEWYNNQNYNPGISYHQLKIPSNEPFYNNTEIQKFYSVFRDERINEIKQNFSELQKERIHYAKKRIQDVEMALKESDQSVFNSFGFPGTLGNQITERTKMIDNFARQLKGEIEIEGLSSWYTNKGRPSQFIEDLRQKLKNQEKLNQKTLEKNSKNNNENLTNNEKSDNPQNLTIFLLQTNDLSENLNPNLQNNLDSELIYTSANILTEDQTLKLKPITIETLPEKFNVNFGSFAILLTAEDFLKTDETESFVEKCLKKLQNQTNYLTLIVSNEASMNVENEVFINQLVKKFGLNFDGKVKEQAAAISAPISPIRLNSDSTQTSDKLTEIDQNQSIFDNNLLKSLIRKTIFLKEQEIENQKNKPAIPAKPRNRSGSRSRSTSRNTRNSQTSLQQEEKSNRQNLELNIVVFVMQEDDLSLDTILEPLIKSKSNNPSPIDNTLTLYDLQLDNDLVAKSVTFTIEPYITANQDVRRKNYLNSLKFDTNHYDAFIFAYNVQRKASLFMMKYAVEECLLKNSRTQLASNATVSTNKLLDSSNKPPAAIIVVTDDDQTEMLNSPQNTEERIIKYFAQGEKIKRDYDWSLLISDRKSNQFESVRTKYGDLLTRAFQEKLARIRRETMSEEERYGPAPGRLKKASSVTKLDIFQPCPISTDTISRSTKLQDSERNLYLSLIDREKPRLEQLRKKYNQVDQNLVNTPSDLSSNPSTLKKVPFSGITANDESTPKRPSKGNENNESPRINISINGTIRKNNNNNNIEFHHQATSTTSNNSSSTLTKESSFLSHSSEHFGRPLTTCHQNLKNQIPFVIERCARHIEEKGRNTEGIYRKPCKVSNRKEFIKLFDQNKYIDFDRFDISTIYGTITWFYGENLTKQGISRGLSLGNSIISKGLTDSLISLLGKDEITHIKVRFKSVKDVNNPNKNIVVFDKFLTNSEMRRSIARSVREQIVRAIKYNLDFQHIQQTVNVIKNKTVNSNYFPPSHYVNLKFLLQHFGNLCRFQEKTKMGISNMATILNFMYHAEPMPSNLENNDSEMSAAEISIRQFKLVKDQNMVSEKLLSLYLHDYECFKIIFPDEISYDALNPNMYLDLKSHRFSRRF